jgi:hypothetical protein
MALGIWRLWATRVSIVIVFNFKFMGARLNRC